MADVPNYPSNSKKTRAAEIPSITSIPAPDEPKPDKVVSGEVTVKKPSLGKRMRESFSGDDAPTVGQYIVFDVIMPAVKSTVVDVVSQGIERLLYGDVSHNRRSNGNGRAQSNNYPGARRVSNPDTREPVSNVVNDYKDLQFETRIDAELVLDKMVDWLRDYDMVSVANLYDMAGITPAISNFQDNKWGWVELRGIAVRGTPRSGYILDLPRPTAL